MTSLRPAHAHEVLSHVSERRSSIRSTELSKGCSFSKQECNAVCEGIASTLPFPADHRCPMLHGLCACCSLLPKAMLGLLL